MTDAPQRIADLEALLARMPGPSETALDAARTHEAMLTKPPGALGRLEAISEWVAAWQHRHPPRIDNPQVVVFAGNHGVAAKGVSAYPSAVTAQMVANFEAGGAAVNQLSKAAGAGFRVVPLDLDIPTNDFTARPALDEEAFMIAFTAGWHVVGNDCDLLAVGEMGIANTTSAAAVCHALYGGAPEDWTGPGTGLTGDALSMKAQVVADAVALHGDKANGPLDILRRLGGRELAAMAGAVVSARFKNCPVLLDGYVSGAAAAVLELARPGTLDHTIAAHISAEPGHRRLLDALGKTPLLDLNMRLGEASGAALAINIVRAAVTCHTGMASFADAGVSDKPE